MRSALLVLISLFFLVSCKDQVPKGVLSENKMQKLLVDVHVLDGKISNMPLDTIRPRIDAYYEQLFKYHQIDSTIFLNSLAFYTSRPVILKRMYEKVNEELNAYLKEQQYLYTIEYEKQRILDSIMHAQYKDSLYFVQKTEVKNRLLRDILFVHEADTTRDEPIPFTFSRYGKYVFNEVGLGELKYILTDSLYESTLERLEKPIQNDLWKNTNDPELKIVDPENSHITESKNGAPRMIVDPKAKDRNFLIKPQTQY